MTAPFECKKCGAKHGMVIEHMASGKQDPLDICENCLFEGCRINPIKIQVSFDEKVCAKRMLETYSKLISEC